MRYPKRLIRALGLLCIAYFAHYLWHRIAALKFWSNSRDVHRLDFAWGTGLQRFNNHAAPLRLAVPDFPWVAKDKKAIHAIVPHGKAVWIVTSELEGLHKTGGIGTAYSELAKSLTKSKLGVEVNILIAHEQTVFTWKQIKDVKETLSPFGITLHFLKPPKIRLNPASWAATTSIRIYQSLDEAPKVDIVHFADNSGLAYYSCLARQQGVSFNTAKIIVGLHGPYTQWAALLNKHLPDSVYELQVDHMERQSVQMADVVVSPSLYMLNYLKTKGWKFPKNSLVIPNLIGSIKAPSRKPNQKVALQEVVFFGRLEERKGLRLLFESFAHNQTFLKHVKTITLLGRDTTDPETGVASSHMAYNAFKSLALSPEPLFQILSNYTRTDAIHYLSNPARLAVIPSLIDNSPNTVLECLVSGVNMLAADTGGISELMRKEDGFVLFPPTPAGLNTKLLEVFETGVLPQADVSMTVSAAQENWYKLHSWALSDGTTKPNRNDPQSITICITHFQRPHLLRQLLQSIETQNYPTKQISVVLIDDGSSALYRHELDLIESEFFKHIPRWRFIRNTKNVYLGEARNIAASHAKSKWILFLDDDDVLKPHALSTLSAVASYTQVDGLSTFLHEFAGDANPNTIALNERLYWFLGDAQDVGLFENTYGSGNIFVKRSTFLDLGGFSTLSHVGAEDWEFWSRFVLRGYNMQVVPRLLIWTRSDANRKSMKYTMDPFWSQYRANTPILEDAKVADLGLGNTLMLARNLAKKQAIAYLVDSIDSFRLFQGWNGFQYSFQPVEQRYVVTPTDSMAQARQADWVFLGISKKDQGGSFSRDTQSPSVLESSEQIAAVRSYTSQEYLDGVLQVSISAKHDCGDGTLVRIILAESEEHQEELYRLKTLDHPKEFFTQAISLSPNSSILIAVEPLKTDACDVVEVELKIREITSTRNWIASPEPAQSAIANHNTDNAQKVLAAASDFQPAFPSAQPMRTHLALIFDQGRLQHALAVVRSALEFNAANKLAFHLVTTNEIAESSNFQEFAEANLEFYNIAQCQNETAWVRSFSHPRIHTSAHCKFFLSEILPPDVKQVLYLDNDVSVVASLDSCYSMPNDKLIGMSLDMGDICTLSPDSCWPLPMSGDKGPAMVNGGVALLNLEQMRTVNFVEQYIQATAETFATTRQLANFGEQDFINAYFRLHPSHLSLLPCGCNYQFRGNFRESVCPASPVSIVHAWDSGATYAEKNSYADVYQYFLQNKTIARPSMPDSSTGSSLINARAPRPDCNCPWQSHDCTAISGNSQLDSLINIIQDDTTSIRQLHPFTEVIHVNSAKLPPIQSLCKLCGIKGSCPPTEAAASVQLTDCACSSEKSLPEKDVLAKLDEAGWIVHLGPGMMPSTERSMAHLLAFARSEEDLLLFSMAEDNVTAALYGRKRFHLHDMPYLGIAYHSNHVHLTQWQGLYSDCGKMKTIASLSAQLSLKWVPPTFSIALSDPLADVEDRVTIVLRGNSTLTTIMQTKYETEAYGRLVDNVLTTESLSPALLAKIGTEVVLLLDASLEISPVALIAMLSSFVAHNRRFPVGPFARLENLHKPQPLHLHMIGNFEWKSLSSSFLLLPRSIMQKHITKGVNNLSPICESEQIASLGRQMRILLPEGSYQDHGANCGLSSVIMHGTLDECFETHKSKFKANAVVGIVGKLGKFLRRDSFENIQEHQFIAQRETGTCI